MKHLRNIVNKVVYGKKFYLIVCNSLVYRKVLKNKYLSSKYEENKDYVIKQKQRETNNFANFSLLLRIDHMFKSCRLVSFDNLNCHWLVIQASLLQTYSDGIFRGLFFSARNCRPQSYSLPFR